MRIRRGSAVVCLVLMLCSLWAGPAASAPLAAPPVVRYVALPADGVADTGACDVSATPCATIQYAVDQSSAGDEIHVATGTYTDTHTLTALPGYPTTGPITQTAVITKDLTLRGGYDPGDNWAHTPGATSRISPADRAGRGLVVLGADPWIEDLTLAAASAIGQGGVPGEPGVDGGGGLYVLGGSPTISGTTFVASTAGPNGRGAGAYVRNGDTKVIGSRFLHNGTSDSGYGGGAAYGGGLYVDGGAIDLETTQWVANEANSAGGGAYLTGSSARIEDVQVTENLAGRCGGLYATGGATQVLTALILNNIARAGDGGGVCSGDGTFELRGSWLNGNRAWIHGGGFVAAGGQVSLADSQFESNTAGQSNSATNAGNGGGVALFGEATSAYTLTNNLFSNNWAYGLVAGGGNGQGGGLYALMTSGTRLISNTFQSNGSFSAGGGAYFDQSNGVSAEQSTFLGNNTLGQGGALVFALSANAALTNTVIAVNTGSSAGTGGLWVDDSIARLWHTTLFANGSIDGSAVRLSGRSPTRLAIPPATVALTNTIIAEQLVGVVADSVGVATLDHTLWDANLTLTATTGSGRIFSTDDYSGTAMFVSPGTDFRLLAISAAIDHGVNAGVTEDLGGRPRPVGLAPDLGAYEFQGAVALCKVPELDPVRSGNIVTYTITLTNTGNLPLAAGLVQDAVTLPLIPGGGPLAWPLPLLAPGAAWTQAVTLTAPTGYSGVITNAVVAMTLMTDTTGAIPGPTVWYTETSRFLSLDLIQYLPLMMKGWAGAD
jgi:hypothetical protein